MTGNNGMIQKVSKKFFILALCGFQLLSSVSFPVYADDFSAYASEVQEEETGNSADSALSADEIFGETGESFEITEPEQPGTGKSADLSDKEEQSSEEALTIEEEAGDLTEESIAEAEPESAAEIEDERTEDIFTDSADAVFSTGTLEGTCSEDGLVTWKLEDGVITISGTGAMDDFITISDWYTGEILESHEQPWKDYCYQIKEVVVENGVTQIGYNAFESCYNLKKITIADTVTYIRHNAFANCPALTDIDLGSGVEKMETDIFWYSPATSLTLPKALKDISEFTFVGMWSLTDIQVEEGNTVFESKDGILYKDNGTTLVFFPTGRQGSVTIPEGTKTIADEAFTQSGVTSVIIPETVTEIGRSVFHQCTQLTSIVFPSSLKTIPKYACMGCTVLTSVTIPEGVTEIETWAFHDCPALEQLTLPSTLESVGDSFSSNTNVTMLNPSMIQMEDGSYVNAVKVPVTVQENYSMAFDVLDLVNQNRTAAGLSELKMDQSLLNTAMQRAAETALYWSHTRPCGLTCFKANSLMRAENIVSGTSSALGAMSLWMKSSGHKANILGSSYTTIGVGSVTVNGCTYWVQCFGEELTSEAERTSYSDQECVQTVIVKKTADYYMANFSVSESELMVGETADVLVKWNGRRLKPSGVVIQSSDSSVCAVENEQIQALKAGSAVIKVFYQGYEEKAASFTITVSPKPTATPKPTAMPTSTASPTSTSAAEGNIDDQKENVQKKQFSQVKLSKSRYVYNGKKKTPSVKVYVGDSRISSKYYTVSYRDNKNVGYATVTIKGKGKYSQYSGTVSFKILPKKETLTKYKSTKKRTISLSWKKDSQVQGYQYQICQNKSFKGSTKQTYTIRKNGQASATVKKLSSGKTYYVRVRSYRKVDGTYLFGSWSSVKKVKVK